MPILLLDWVFDNPLVSIMSSTSASPSSQASRPSLALIVSIMLVASVEFLQNGMLNVAASQIMGSIGAGPELFSHAAMVYAGCAVIALFHHDWLAARFGSRRLVAISLGLFAAGALMCAMSYTPGMFIVGRAVQGTGGAAFFTATRVEVQHLPPSRRVSALLCFGYALLLGSALGPLLAGLALQYGSWRWIFLGLVPFAGVAGASLSVWPRRPMHAACRRAPTLTSWLALVAGVFVLQWLIQQAPYVFFGERGLWLAVALCFTAIGLLLVLGWREGVRRSLFRQSRYVLGLGCYFICYCLVAANNYVMPALVQQVFDYDWGHTGLLLSVSFFAGIGIASLYALAMLRGWVKGLRWPLVMAALLLAGYGLAMTMLSPEASLLRLGANLMLNGAFMSLFIIAVAQATFRDLDGEVFPTAYQVKNIVRQVAISSAVAGSTVFLQWRNALHYSRLGEGVAAGNPAFVAMMESLGQALPNQGQAVWMAQLVKELLRQSMLLSCLDFYRFEAVAGLVLALLVYLQRRIV